MKPLMRLAWIACVLLAAGDARAGLVRCPDGAHLERQVDSPITTVWCVLAGQRHGPYRRLVVTETETWLSESGSYDHGELHGVVRFFAREELELVIEYRHGQRHGRYERYLWGEPAEIGSYADGRPTGVWVEREFFSDGAVKSESHRLAIARPRYPGSPWWDVEWQLHGPMHQWHSNGRLAFEGTYLEGKPHGTHRGYRADGVLAWRDDYLYGERHGLSERYWQHGGQTELYRHGVLHGPWSHRHGNVLEHRVYEEGRVVDRWVNDTLAQQ